MRVNAHLAPSARSTGRGFTAHDLERITEALAVAARGRAAQLDALPPASTSVAVAHRDSVQRILDAIRDAQAQLADGTYGDCVRCNRPASLSAALSRPWLPLCDSCAPR